MGMTITEKILARACGREAVQAGEFINARLDLALANDITAPLAIKEFEAAGAEKVWDPERVVLVCDHFVPNKDIKSAEQAKFVRDFARRQGLSNFYDVGRMGIEHVILPEKGLVVPGDVVIGADSHTCTYGALGAFATGVGSTDLAAGMATGEVWLRVPETIRFNLEGTPGKYVTGKDYILYIIGLIGVDGALYSAMEFAGGAMRALSMDGRFTMCNMAIEAGGKSGIVEPDEVTAQYCRGRVRREPAMLASDADAVYAQVIDIDVAGIQPQVARPHLPSNAVAASELAGLKIDQVVIGSCTNGRIEDLRMAAAVMKGRKVNPDVRTIVIPGSQEVYQQAMHEGLIDIFIDAEAAVSTPTCGPCLGGHMGILAAGERAVSTTNRNFVGRMGHVDSEVYLAGPYVAAATAIAGTVAVPGEVLS
ncbi:MAG: 3-isopropylmalate dehydratase large subunit [Actinomycetota bacterium]|nr:3-isopropylmalate dehydratase large subunit [Actinomycetota bacterium]MCL6093183.1 3-isopropylmalate dehydratase large subunit [Actinomycetota bacterium]MDA8167001.1 3-isopropylmalate dehydratase large subunit [Actinomycetota bacterium]